MHHSPPPACCEYCRRLWQETGLEAISRRPNSLGVQRTLDARMCRFRASSTRVLDEFGICTYPKMLLEGRFIVTIAPVGASMTNSVVLIYLVLVHTWYDTYARVYGMF